MLSALPGVLVVPAETSVMEGVQPVATPWQESFRKIFWIVPGVSVVPFGDANTKTP